LSTPPTRAQVVSTAGCGSGTSHRPAAGFYDRSVPEATDVDANEPTRIQVRRIYEVPRPDDGKRVLVDRLWPRGVSKVRADIDEWCKEIAPSADLRIWYHHQPELFPEFTRRYLDELREPAAAAAVRHLEELAAHSTLTLLTATKVPAISEAAVLADLLIQHRRRSG
jgi:uncharacterized protein YeaO (DUF488 family)